MELYILIIFGAIVAVLSAIKSDDKVLLPYPKGTPENSLQFPINKKMNFSDSSENQLITYLLKSENKSNQKRGLSTYQTCDCRQNIRIDDLGFGHYPRYLINMTCTQNFSTAYHSTCIPIEYKTSVLTRRPKDDILSRDPLIAQIPARLRSEWKFKKIMVITGCACAY